MPTSKPFLISKDRVKATLNALHVRILAPSELSRLVGENMPTWQLADEEAAKKGDRLLKAGKVWQTPSSNYRDIAELLVREAMIQRINLPFPYRAEQRFTLGKVAVFELVQSLDGAGYFTHFTALQLNDLTEQIPKTIYFNVEQSATGRGGTLTQEGLDRAFRGKPRVSSNVIEYKGTRICRLNGRSTDQLGVVDITPDDSPTSLRVTNVERTLIDATVRPSYSGGVTLVAKAFEAAKGRASVNRIAAYLTNLSYTYPYHQAVGFYLERAGYSESQLSLVRKFPMRFDFYLTHAMRATDYCEKWRLFIPKGF